MRGMLGLLPLLLACARPALADVAVRAIRGRVDVAAKAAPLAEVLDSLARQTGMKVVYEGPAPRQLVTLSLADRSPAEAVTAILEGQGLNYALILDITATRVEKLLLTGPRSATGISSVPVRRGPTPPVMRAFRPVDEDEPEDAGDAEDEAVNPPPAGPAVPERPVTDAPAAAPDKSQARPRPTAPVPAPTPIPLIPNPAYSSSPFNPRPIQLIPAPQPSPTPTPSTTPP